MGRHCRSSGIQPNRMRRCTHASGRSRKPQLGSQRVGVFHDPAGIRLDGLEASRPPSALRRGETQTLSSGSLARVAKGAPIFRALGAAVRRCHVRVGAQA